MVNTNVDIQKRLNIDMIFNITGRILFWEHSVALDKLIDGAANLLKEWLTALCIG